MARRRKRRSAWVDLVIAGLMSSIVPAAGAWHSRNQAHAEAVTRQVDDQAYRMAALDLRRERSQADACDAARALLGDRTAGTLLNAAERRSLAVKAERKAESCLALPPPKAEAGPSPAPAKEPL